jgi:hypothetical protein
MSERDPQRILRGISRVAGPMILGAAVVMNQEGGEPPLTAPHTASVIDFNIQATTTSASTAGSMYGTL